MYEIRYNQYHIKFGEADLNLGLGYEEDKILLLFTSGDPLEDSYLSFTGAPLGKWVVFEQKDFMSFECNVHNLIPIHEALQEVAYILEHKARSQQLKWYSN